MATGITQIVPRYMHYGETFSLSECWQNLKQATWRRQIMAFFKDRLLLDMKWVGLVLSILYPNRAMLLFFHELLEFFAAIERHGKMVHGIFIR